MSEYTDLIKQIVAKGKKWHALKHRIAGMGYSQDVWHAEFYKVARREERALDRGARKLFKDIVQRWLAENGFEDTNVQTQACFHLPGMSTGYPPRQLSLGFGLHQVAIHNAKHAVQTRYKWLNKIVVCGGEIQTDPRARTDLLFTWDMAEKFAAFTQEVQDALRAAFAGR